MERTIQYKDLKDNYILIDVRSPGEYKEYCIPGAINIPLLDDEERKVVGTVYKHESSENAKELGIEFVSKKLPDIYKKIIELSKEDKDIVVYCARGGMRSGSICSLLDSLGIKVWKLEGGYKAYRAFVREELERMNQYVNYIVLHGYTGVGKTLILEKLGERGLDVLDLEKYANHRGSLLGLVGLGETRSQKQFESLIYEKLKNRKTNNVFIEAESRRIGNIIIPNYIKDKMEKGKHILIEASIEERAKRIVSEYTKNENCKKEIIEALRRFKKLLNQKTIEELISLVECGKYFEAAKILMEKYYDPLYEYSQKKYNYDLIVNSDSIDKACKQIEIWLKEKVRISCCC